jgi:hypothetical protein
MSQSTNYRALVAIAVLAFAATSLRAQKVAPAAAPDAGLYTNYSLNSNDGQTTVQWLVCGSTQNSDGCYGIGQIGPFIAVGAMLEGDPVVKGNVVTRAIYVADSGRASKVKLYVYKKVDTVTANYDTVTVTLKRAITLPLVGGSNAICSMAANKDFLFIGTDQSEFAAMVQKNNLVVTQVGDGGGNVIAITSDQYGFVTITNTEPGSSGFAVYGPTGGLEGFGGGAEFMLTTTQAVPLTNLAGGSVRPASHISYKAKVAAQVDVK